MADKLSKKSLRASDALEMMIKKGDCYFFTLTTPDNVDIKVIRERWRSLRNWLIRRLNNPLYIMNYELHPGYLQKKIVDNKSGHYHIIHSDGRSHGWHIHGVINSFVNLRLLLKKIQSFGFGRCDFRRVTSKGVSDYLTKHALKAYRGLSRRDRARYGKMRFRLVNCSRGLPALKSYNWKSYLNEKIKSISTPEISRRVDDYRVIESCEGIRLSRDFRAVFIKARVLALMGYSHFYQWATFIEHAALIEKCVSTHMPSERQAMEREPHLHLSESGTERKKN